MNPTLTNIDIQLQDLSKLIEGSDIVIVGLQPWYFKTGCNCKYIAEHFAKTNRVLYVNFPIKRKAFWEKIPNPKIERHISIIKEGKENLLPIGNNLWEYYPATLIDSINWLPSTNAFSIVNYINNRRFARDIKKAMTSLGFKNVILFNDNDVYNGFYLKELLSPRLYIYYLRDFLQGYNYWKKHTKILEPQLLKKSDIVAANSKLFADYSSRFNPNSYYIGQGCNIDLFNADKTYNQPEEMKHIASPIIGYLGALDASRLDMKIFELIAKARPDWNIVLVGPEDDFFKQSSLHKIQNIHFLGAKKIEDLPSYVASFDVCINPQFKNVITEGNYPLKIDEYLAMGKPAVATKTAAMELFEEYTYLANEPEEYPALIEKALSENSVERQTKRLEFARTHTWENSVNAIYKAISVFQKQTTLQ